MKENEIIFYKGGNKKYLSVDKQYQIYRLRQSIEYWVINIPDDARVKNLIKTDTGKLLAYKSLIDIEEDFETIHDRRKRISGDLSK